MSKRNYTLHVAADRGYTRILLELINQGADVNALDEEGETPLHYAVRSFADRSRPEKVVRLLLEHGADVHIRSTEGGTVLQSAAWLGSLETMRMLLDYGAAADPRDAQLALRNCFYACGHNKAPLLIAAGARMGLIEAIYRGDLQLIERLLKEGANADDYDGEYTPIMHSLSAGHTMIVVDLLLTAGANINRTGSDDTTALMIGQIRGIEDVVALIRRGADVNQPISTGETPLMRAIIDYPEQVATLIQEGADVNAQDKQGKTPLMLAREHKRRNLIEPLKRAGALR